MGKKIVEVLIGVNSDNFRNLESFLNDIEAGIPIRSTKPHDMVISKFRCYALAERARILLIEKGCQPTEKVMLFINEKVSSLEAEIIANQTFFFEGYFGLRGEVGVLPEDFESAIERLAPKLPSSMVKAILSVRNFSSQSVS